MLFEVLDDLVHRRRCASEVVVASRAQLRSLEQRPDPIAVSLDDAALEEARALDGVAPSPSRPLAGVPVLVDARLSDGEGVVARARSLGAVVVGRVWSTTGSGPLPALEDPGVVDESCATRVLDAAVSRVALGAVPLALVPDALGSLRVAAADVGLASVHVRPWVLGDAERLSDGVVAATLSETAWAIDVLRDPEGRGRLLTPFTLGQWRPTRIGVWGRVTPGRARTDEDAVLDEAASALEADGVECIDVDDAFCAPWWSLVEARRALEAIATTQTERTAREVATGIVAAFVAAENAVRAASARVRRVAGEFDALLAPSTVGSSGARTRAGEVVVTDDDTTEVGRVHVANLAKLAATSIPVRRGDRSLGVEFLATSEPRAVAAAACLARRVAPRVLAARAVPW
ncbi:hypothetical protein Afer_1642 [Acidimicrobium ferrooxidans DSM 10331]|uniref:Amidase n=1 Tax=Acidimicrobium ferrooxidans (strain DSM 10331 / JCM 15462 / NBRC 103882 / ICP) TaxID=525909 RepID=C7M0Q0_ACIFD|nr:hypothetical protein [Acidimicrobium ferrooxidans]ACU54558.1 hypothetical protein Afer_1642 [Acidimicrobium ferrooxidans DSM 10331]